MRKLEIAIDAMRRQLLVHGYHLTDAELRDCAANTLMALDADEAGCICSAGSPCDFHFKTMAKPQQEWRPSDATDSCPHDLVEVKSVNGRNLEGAVRECVRCEVRL